MSNKEKAIKCYLDGLTAATKAFAKYQNPFIFYLNVEQAKLQASIILSQPTLPEFATGGIVSANTRTGDLITVPVCKKGYNPPSGTTTIVVNIDTGKPGGDSDISRAILFAEIKAVSIEDPAEPKKPVFFQRDIVPNRKRRFGR